VSSLSAGDYRRVLKLVAVALGATGPDFPDTAVVDSMRELVAADYGGAARIVFRKAASRRWGDTPSPLVASDGEFHKVAAAHPLVRVYRATQASSPLRLSDVDDSSRRSAGGFWPDLPHVLAFPVALTTEAMCGMAFMRSGRDFRARDIELVRQTQPVLSGILALRGHRAEPVGPAFDLDLDIPLTARELAVLNLMADGLITAAIARQLGISPRTVGKHIENIYCKLGTHDRVSAVVRGYAHGLIGRTGG
jgi:DNA-binding CsgD family transcriptional regulator